MRAHSVRIAAITLVLILAAFLAVDVRPAVAGSCQYIYQQCQLPYGASGSCELLNGGPNCWCDGTWLYGDGAGNCIPY